MARGKNYTEKVKDYDKLVLLSPMAAIKQVRELSFAKFDETVEVHYNLGIDPKQAEQQLRGTISLPHGTGQKIKIAVITNGEKAAALKNSEADYVGSEDIIEKIEGGWLDFDLLIATPDMMSKLGKLGRILGAKGLMPTPKNGTVTNDVENAVKEFKAGKVEYRNDKAGLLHVILGKISFTDEQLYDNFVALYDTVMKVKPAKSKGVYLKSISLCATMSASARIETFKNKWKELS
jgi:large subunit ribosomal protein L1